MYRPDDFQRTDESNDSLFYSFPRLVVHIDQQAIEAVGRLFREQIPPEAVVLDLMSSWRSHWPQGHPKNRMIGLGLNAEEMADNPDLDEYIIHDLNREPVLPLEDEAFDAVVLTVSAQYLTRPVETFDQVNRVLRTGGVFIVTFSNRMFPTKAVRIWRESTDQDRMKLVTSYMESAGNLGKSGPASSIRTTAPQTTPSSRWSAARGEVQPQRRRVKGDILSQAIYY